VVDEGVDTGPILAQRELEILPDETEAELHERIKSVERSLIVQTVREIAEQKIRL
jgi:phosphoribosylglycinamide formyltransferase-1